jgi:hypothetical protein
MTFTKRNAVECEHIHVSSDNTESFKTRWEDTQELANTRLAEYETQGAFFCKIFYEPKSCLGAFRIVAHFKL